MICLWICSQFTLKSENKPATQARTFSLALEPLGLKKIKSGASHMLTDKVGFQCKFSGKCLLPQAHSQKFLSNSTSPSVYDCSLTLRASKTKFRQQQQKSWFPVQGDVTVTSTKLAVSKRELRPPPCDLFSYYGNSCQAHNSTLSSQGEKWKHFKI